MSAERVSICNSRDQNTFQPYSCSLPPRQPHLYTPSNLLYLSCVWANLTPFPIGSQALFWSQFPKPKIQNNSLACNDKLNHPCYYTKVCIFQSAHVFGTSSESESSSPSVCVFSVPSPLLQAQPVYPRSFGQFATWQGLTNGNATNDTKGFPYRPGPISFTTYRSTRLPTQPAFPPINLTDH